MKGTVQVLICDGTPDSQGNIYRAEGLELLSGEVPVILEFREGDLASYVGKAKLRLDASVLYADLLLLDVKLPDPALAVLYPAPAMMVTEKKGQVVTKAVIRYMGLSIGAHADPRIDTLHKQGVKP